MAAKRAEESAQFCAVPRKSIKLLAESVGISSLSSEAAGALAEDVTYRVREVIQNAICFVKHSKRDHLTGEDINRTLFWSHVEPIYGYGSKNSNVFSSISMRDGDLYFHEDKEVNLRELTFSKGLASLNELGNEDSKICVELTLLSEETAKNEPSTGDPANSSTSESSRNFDSLSDVLKSYYNQITRIIINGDSDTVKIVFADLRDNPRVQIFLPYLVHFITIGIKSLSGDSEKLLRLFSLIKILVDNKNLYLEPYVVQLVRAVMHCLIEKPASKTNGAFDEWILRDSASQILCHIDRKCSNTTNYLHHQLLRTFKDIYEDTERPLHSQYGAIIGLSMLGIEVVEQTILPHFKSYAEHLETLQKDTSSAMEKLNIMDALKRSALIFFRSKLQTISTKDNCESHKVNKSQASSTESEISSKSNSESNKTNKDIVEWYNSLYQFYGESFSLLSGNLEDYKSIVQSSTSNALSDHGINRQSVNIVQTRKLIQNARKSKTPKHSEFVSVFSFEAKRRRLDNTDSTSCPGTDEVESDIIKDDRVTFHLKYNSLNNNYSEERFEDLIEKSCTYRRGSSDWKKHVRKCRYYAARRTTSSSTTGRQLSTALSVSL